MCPSYLQSKTVVHKNFDAFLILAKSTCEFMCDLCGVWSVVNNVATTLAEKIGGVCRETEDEAASVALHMHSTQTHLAPDYGIMLG